MKANIEKYHKHVNEYFSIGEIPSSGKRYIQVVKDKLGNYYVKKCIKYDTDREENFYFKREVSCMIEAQQRGLPFISLIEFEYPTREEDGYIIMPYMQGGSVMKQIIKKNGDASVNELESSDLYFSPDMPHIAFTSNIPVISIDLNETRKMIIVYGTAKAISFLHQKNPIIIHRDIKPENILLDANGEPHLSDFGFSREISIKEKMSGTKGTTPYMAPELVRDEVVSVSADIYSFGVTMIMLFSEKLIYKQNGVTYDFYTISSKKQMDCVLKGVKYEIPDSIPEQLRDLITRCCDINPQSRPTIIDVLSILESDKITKLYDHQYKDYINKFK